MYENTHNLLPDAFECASRVLKNEEKIMALLNILQYPDERLHTVAKPVEQVDERIQKLVADMFETMYEARGIGLAARKAACPCRAFTTPLPAPSASRSRL